MPTISTLIPDIQKLITTRGWFNDELAKEFSTEVGRRLQIQFNEGYTPRLRLSRMGPRCPKALWLSIHKPELAEKMPPWAEVKFSFGHILEAWAITLAKAAGHSVTGEQDELRVDDVTGHRDCVIDGCLVDVKSAASPSFKKFKDGSLAQADTFGYLDQLDGYLVGSAEDPLVTTKDRGFLFAIDKQLGHMCLYEHMHTPERAQKLRDRIAEYKRIVSLPKCPECECGTEEASNGNISLDTRASYSEFKFSCFPQLRCFLYSGGPEYLSVVVKHPWNKNGPLPEIDRHGSSVYH